MFLVFDDKFRLAVLINFVLIKKSVSIIRHQVPISSNNFLFWNSLDDDLLSCMIYRGVFTLKD